MKTIFLFCILFSVNLAIAQDYKPEWEKVMKYEDEGQIKSASEITAQIYIKTKKDKNEPQLIKTFFYRAKYIQILDEEAQVKILQLISKEKAALSVPGKAIMESIYAEMLYSVHQKNRYTISQRVIVDGAIPEDFLTWTTKNFEDEVRAAYNRSIENKEILYKIPITDYQAIIDFNPELAELNRPLLDLLAERYLNGMSHDSRYIDEYNKLPVQVLLGNIEQFSVYQSKGATTDATARLDLSRELESLYKRNNDSYNLQRSALRRLEYAESLFYSRIKDSLYLNTLLHLSNQWKTGPFAERAKLRAAVILKETADKLKAPQNNIRAVKICDSLISTTQSKQVMQNAKTIRAAVLHKDLTVIMEKQLIANKPFLASLTFRNLDSVQVNIYRINPKKGLHPSHIKDFLQKNQPVIKKTYKLPKITNHFHYNTEIIMPALQNGTYAIVITPVLKDSVSALEAIAFVQASDIALLEQSMQGATQFQVVNRATGKPIKNAYTKYNRKKYYSDKKGILVINRVSNEKEILSVIYKNDTVQSNRYGYYYRNDNDNVRAKAQIYIDRPIYRPGQKVYFKGILLFNNKGSISTVSDTYVTVTVEDPNDDEVTKLRLKTNTFGSVAGEFNLPQTLTGGYRITIGEDEEYDIVTGEDAFYDMEDLDFEDNSLYFNVEEYKRPTFEVTFDNIKNDIKIGEKAKVTGVARSFSGAAVQNAEVKYSILCYGKFTRKGYDGNPGNKDNINGKTMTDAEGKFTIDFNAVPDFELDAKGLPLFTFTVKADVTDLAGETRSNSTSVYGGYHSIALTMVVPEEIDPAHPDKNIIRVSASNLNHQEKVVKGEIKIYKLVEQEQKLLKRSWSLPEIQSIPEKEFRVLFPHYAYADNPEAGKQEKQVFTEKIDTGLQKELKINPSTNWLSGEYEAVLTAIDSSGYIIEKKSRFKLIRDTDAAGAANNPLQVTVANKDFIKDGYITLKLRSQLPLLYVNVWARTTKQLVYEKQVVFKGEDYSIKIPVSGQMGHEVVLSIDYVWENRAYNFSRTLTLGQENELKISAETLTNKLAPGSGQTWSFTIGGNLPSEALAAMYDASLDKFSTLQWDKVNPYKDYYYSAPYKYFASGTECRSFMHYRMPEIKIVENESSLYTFGFNINQSKNIYLAYTLKRQLPGSGDYLMIGTVTDISGMPIPGVSVSLPGTSEGIQTDFDGNYSIYASKGDSITFSFVGMKTTSVTAEASGTLNIIMEDDVTVLSDVVVEGYRTTSMLKSSVAAVTVTSETLEGRPNVNFIQSLQGQIPGLTINTGSGQPGSATTTVILRGTGSLDGNINPLYIIDGVPMSAEEFRSINADELLEVSLLKADAAVGLYGNRGVNGVVVIKTRAGLKETEALQQVQTRKNFNETAFFYPQLHTDEKGNIKFTFSTPEALTEWKLRVQAHNTKAESGYLEKSFYTQKDLMVVPNMPRFLRERDTVVIKAKIINLTPNAMQGNALLQLFDPVTLKPVDAELMNIQSVKPFTTGAKGTIVVNWTIAIPAGLQGLQYKLVAKAGDFADGEENILPVLTNRMLVTESLPLWVKPHTTKQYVLENFKNNTSHTLKHHGITLEYTSNPAWAALQSLPYLMEYEHDCSEQVFSRYYANAIGSYIITSNPKIAEVFAEWRSNGKPVSKLEQNEVLKSIILAETPWVLDAQSEDEKKNRMALLFSLEKMKPALDNDFDKLEQRQSETGGFPWFSGGVDSEFITRHIVAGLGHLRKLDIKDNNDKITAITKDAVSFLDTGFLKEYKLNKKNKASLYNDVSGLHYLYARSFYLDVYPLADTLKKITGTYYISTLKNKWKELSLYEKGMVALVLHRFGETVAAKKIITSLRETSSNNEEWGMYWIENKAGLWWYRAPIETQALLIEAFIEVDNDVVSADAMKVWLLKNKQNKSWPTTKATTEAVYALLMQGSNWLSVKDDVKLSLGSKNTVEAKIATAGKEAGTGYIKLNWKASEITPDMASLTIENNTEVPGYGGLYWQYFEDLDRIKPAQEAIMNITKELYKKQNSTNGVLLQPITPNKQLKTGDLVTIRLVIKVEEDVEYVHLKDLRAAAFEPVDVLSGYEWKDGLGFYKSTKDVATHYFFDRINKGTYVLEYDVKVNNTGEYSNGITTIQSMYAPEFSSHTKGARIKSE